ncbi:hypothetical protein Tco_0347542 [Tanacetum coccineum]
MHTLELKSHTYYKHGTFESFTYWKLAIAKEVEESAGLSNVDAHVDVKIKKLKRLATHPSIATPSKPIEDRKKKDSLNKDTRIPSLSNILHNSINIQSNTIITLDGNVQSYYGRQPLPNNTNVGEKQQIKSEDIRSKVRTSGIKFINQGGKRSYVKKLPSFQYVSLNLLLFTMIFVLKPPWIRAIRKVPKRAALTSAGVLVTYHNHGPPSYQCRNCNAQMWYKERNNKGYRAVNPTFSLCCQEGKLLLPKFKETPLLLDTLHDFKDPGTSKFRDQIRVYNGMFFFTSFSTRIDHSINTGRGVYTFRINGQNYHRIGYVLLASDIQPRYTQLYFFDTHNEVRNWMSAFHDKETSEGVDETIVVGPIVMLDETSAVAKAF